MKTLGLDDFRAANTSHSNTCGFKAFLAKLPKADVATIRAAVADPEIQATAISRVLKARYGWGYDSQGIMRHRRGNCASCAKPGR